MIHVNREAIRPPTALKSRAVTALAATVQEFYKRRLKSRRQERFDIPRFPDAAFKEIIDSLRRLFSNKCAYCETPFAAGHGGLDRFRPMAGAVGLHRDYSPDHYWWHQHLQKAGMT